MNEDESPGRRPRRHRVAIGLVGAALLLAAGYVAAWYSTGERVPNGTSVSGVDIGGLTSADARSRLTDELAAWSVEPIALVHGSSSYELDPAEAGLSLDVEATVRDAGAGRTWNPVRIVDSWFGSGEDVDPVLDVDEAALDRAVGEIADRVERLPVEPEVTFRRTGRPVVSRPQVGHEVDEEAVADDVVERYLRTRGPIPLTVDETPPAVGREAFAQAMRDVVRPAVSGPVVLQIPGQTLRLEVHHFARALRYSVADGGLRLSVDADRLATDAQEVLEDVHDAPTDATVKLRGGRPVVVPAKPGVAVDLDVLADRLPLALEEDRGDRRVEVGVVTVRPDFTTKDARRLGIKRVVSSFVTYYPHADYRNVNQSRAAELISGTVLRPGDVFSFNDTVGERTEENGFTKGYIIRNGVYAEDLGGGVSQVVTTTYNAAFFAGLEDIEHKPHSFYIDRYPLGREATVAWPYVDLKFRNDTPYGVLVEAWVVPSTPTSSGEMHVRMWSTKHWDIEAGVSERYDFTEPEVRHVSADDCVPTTGYGGFDVDVYRYFRHPGSDEVVRKETQTVTYTPADTVICD